MKISVITINYNSQQLLEKFLDSFRRNLFAGDGPYQFEFIVVNNDQNDLILKTSNLETIVINNNNNLGFAAANNIGASRAAGEYLLFINPDVLIKNNSLLKMFDFIHHNNKIGAIGPNIYLPEQKRTQPWTCGKKTSLSRIIFRNSLNQPWNSHKRSMVDWVSGTALMTRKVDFDSINGFDEKFFMYFEDQDLCLRIKTLNKDICYFPEATIEHLDGKSWKSHFDKKRSYYQSQDYFFQKHHGSFQAKLLQGFRFLLRAS